MRARLLAALAAGAVACSRPTAPVVVPLGSSVHFVAPDMLLFTSDLDVLNPNAFPITPVDTRSELTIDEKNPVAAKIAREPVTIGPHAHATLRVVVGASAGDFVFPPATSGPIPFVIGGTVSTPTHAGSSEVPPAHYVIQGTFGHEELKALFAARR